MSAKAIITSKLTGELMELTAIKASINDLRIFQLTENNGNASIDLKIDEIISNVINTINKNCLIEEDSMILIFLNLIKIQNTLTKESDIKYIKSFINRYIERFKIKRKNILN